MIAIGFRVEPSEVQSALHWAVVEGTKEHPIFIGADTVKVPKTYDEVQALSWFRNEAQRIIKTYAPDRMFLRTPEFKQRNPKFASLYKRCRIEGVVIEIANSLGLKSEMGALKTLSKNIESSHSAKDYLEDREYRGLDWSKHKDNVKDAILAASSVLPSD